MKPEERIERALARYRETQRRLHEAERIPDERQERTISTLKVAMLYALVYVVAVIILTVFLLGCGKAHGPTLPYEELTERQRKVYDYTQCFARALEVGPVTVTFHENLNGNAGQAWPGSHHVEYHVLSVENGPDWYLQAIAAHEVCHLSGIWDEKATEACAILWIAKGVCP